MRPFPFPVLLVGQLLGASACLPLRYLPHAATGQARLLLDRRPLQDAARDPRVDARTRRLLGLVPRIKAWGRSHGVEPARSFEHYVDVGRPAVAWVVSASPPLALGNVTWSFPVAGSFPYLGWFSREAALEHAASVAAQGMDVHVRGVSAYSTLGWLPDPVLSTMLRGDDEEAVAALLANTVLHEGVHATVFIRDQVTFNESLASFVADTLTPACVADVMQAAPGVALRWERDQQEVAQRTRRLHAAAEELAQVYAADIPDAEKYGRKARILAALQRDVPSARPWNNASLGQFLAYHSGSAAWQTLLAACGGETARLLAAVRGVGPADFKGVQSGGFDALLLGLAQRGCPAR